MFRRRLLVIAAACTALLGVAAIPFAASASAETTHVYSPVPTGLVRLCVSVEAADAGLCLHL